MRTLPFLAAAAAFTLALSAPMSWAQDESDVINEPDFGGAPRATGPGGEQNLFDGETMGVWEGLPQYWSVKDGAITGQVTEQTPLKGNNTFLIWRGGEVGDFELTLKYKIANGNSGVQYRSKVLDRAKFVVGGYQGDFEAGKTYSGILYEEQGRGIIAKRGEKVTVKDGDAPKKPKIEVTGTLGTSEEIQAVIKDGDWNELRIVAKGNHLQHFINGKQTVDVTDEGTTAAKTGVLALQLHAGGPMMVQFKDIVLKPVK